ncbi:MAG: ATP-dependent DNA helicase [Planctomycetes bacterium]|nr:ATP-dependent DNA helicase [Planctomycetota bacterium]
MTDGAVRAWFASDGAIARRLTGYESRDEQVELAVAIERALHDREHLCAEAGTGVGKSFAYLLPAVLQATEHVGDGPVVVSTRTIALQEQLERKDLPFLHSVMPQEWSSVTVVGRNHYLCLRRMHLARREADVLFDIGDRIAQLERIVAWSSETHDGLRMELAEPVDHEVWDEVKAEHGNCLHRACKHYDACAYQRSRRRLESAQILVVNHALYMADVALRMAGAKYLPDHRVVVFDEAHHLERVATESLGLRLTLGTVLWHLRRLHPRRARRSLLAEHGTRRAIQLVDDLREIAAGFFALLEERIAAVGGRAVDLGDAPIDDPLSHFLGELVEELGSCASRIVDVDARMELQARSRGLAALAHVVGSLCRPGDGSLVRWIEPDRKSPVLRSAPVEVSAALREWVFTPERSCVLLSATLGPGNDPEFAWTRSQLGIDDARTLRLGSPFDYSRNVEVEFAEAMPDPQREADAFLRECKRRVREAVLENGGRALVLCTSWKFVHALADALRPTLELEDIPLLVQGEAPLRNLLEAKRERPTSVLIGTESLWEGIDVRGDALTLLVLTRFPFAQPDHPLTRARHRAIEARGGNPFVEQSLPEAVLKFRQGFGRLIRSHEDRGRVLVLDPRTRTRRYGRAFLDALPPGACGDDVVV